MKFQIKHRLEDRVLFECELSAEVEDKLPAVQMGFAVRLAREASAYLRDADLRDAYLRGADLEGAHLIDGGQRADGYRFVGQIKDGELWISAGCRYWPISRARDHWGSPNYRSRALGDESLLILDRIEGTAKIRGLLAAAKEAA